jgi:hypothetical protein
MVRLVIGFTIDTMTTRMVRCTSGGIERRCGSILTASPARQDRPNNRTRRNDLYDREEDDPEPYATASKLCQ